ncbi:hypothetical protein ABEX47_02225 [Paenibacillus ehimensis]|nr:hypothetical protein [Paenibacillus ehimensis]
MSTVIVEPVTKPHSSDAKNRETFATSPIMASRQLGYVRTPPEPE